MKELKVELGERSYPIYIGEGLIQRGDLLEPFVAGNKVMIVTNETVAPLYERQVVKLFDRYSIDVVRLPDGEKFKNWETLNLVFDALLSKNHSRKTTLVALGGGVVGDMTGFAAAAYQRGVDFIQIPTTILSQVDSSVGGKTAINHPLGKNMIGAFHQPRAVLIDTSTLKTLPSREVSAGLAEVIKYGLIRDAAFFSWLEQNIQLLRKLDPAALAYTIKTSCQCKADIVAEDEKENGVRALLNLGHTFGHAIENFMGYGNWLHGEAVAAGMAMAAELSVAHGWMQESDFERIHDLLEKAGLPVVPPSEMTQADFMSLMSVDKKVMDGSLRLVLLRGIGSAVVTDQFDPALLSELLAQ